MQLSKEEYARKRIHNGSSLRIENSITRVTLRHHSASLVMPNSYTLGGIFNPHLTTIKDSYILAYPTGISAGLTSAGKCHLTPGCIRRLSSGCLFDSVMLVLTFIPSKLYNDIVVDRSRMGHSLTENVDILCAKLMK